VAFTGEAIGFLLSSAAVAQAMEEISTFSRNDDQDKDQDAQAARLQETREHAEGEARVLVYEQENAWILLTNAELQSESGMQGRVGKKMRWQNKIGKYMVGIIVQVGPGTAKMQTQIEELPQGAKPRKPISVELDRKFAMAMLDEEWAAKWMTSYVDDSIKKVADAEAEAAAKKTNTFEYRYRVRVEQEARRKGGENDAAWMDGSHIKPEELVGCWVDVVGKDKGQVTDYQLLVGLHTIQFEEAGTQAVDLSSVEWRVMSEKFVALYSERIVAEWERKRRQKRQDMRKQARARALEEPETWISANHMDLNELKGEDIDVRGKGRGTVVGAKQNKLSVLLDKDVSDAKVKGESEATPVVIDPLKTKFRAKDPVFIRMYLLRGMTLQ
jgi:hypothetical protein